MLDRKSSTVNSYTPPSYAWCFSKIEWIFLEHSWVLRRNFLVLWQKQLLSKNRDVPHLCLNFFDTRTFWITSVLLGIVFFRWEKTYSTENCDTRPFPWSLLFFDSRFFLKDRRVPLRKIKTKKNFDGKSGISPLMHDFFWYPNPPETQELLFKMFRFCETKQFRLKIVIFVYPAPPLSLTFSDTRIIQKHERLPLQLFWYCKTTNFWRKKVILPPAPLF